jgi:CRP-like cAMP-binding protein
LHAAGVQGGDRSGMLDLPMIGTGAAAGREPRPPVFFGRPPLHPRQESSDGTPAPALDAQGSASIDMGIDTQLRSMTGLGLRPTATATRRQRFARVVSPTRNPRQDDQILMTKLSTKPRSRDVGRRYEGEEIDRILTGRNSVFANCSGRQLRLLREVGEQIQYERYTEVVSEGVLKESARHYFLIVEGWVVVRTLRGYQARLGPGDCFGEIALIAERPRMLTVNTLTQCLMLRVAADELATKTLKHVVIEAFPRIELYAKVMLLRTLPYFSRLSEAVVEGIVPYFNYSERPRGTYLCYAGDPSRYIYIVAFGAVEALIDDETRVGLCSSVDDKPWIGELALFKDTPRVASLRVAEPSHLLTLDVDATEEIVKIAPSLMEIFRSVELADVYARMKSAGDGLSQLLRGELPLGGVASDWRELLGSNFFARRAHFAGSLGEAPGGGDVPRAKKYTHRLSHGHGPRHRHHAMPTLFF